MTGTVRSVSAAVARVDLAALIEAVAFRGETVQVTRYNKPVAYLVSMEWFERAQHALNTPQDVQDVQTFKSVSPAHHDVPKDVHTDVHTSQDPDDWEPTPTADPTKAFHGFRLDEFGNLRREDE